MAVLISIKPQYVCKILNKEKILEIRKSIPKCKLPCKVYIYCTKGKDLWMHNKETIILGNTDLTSYWLNGKVVAEFTLNRYDEIERDLNDWLPKNRYEAVKQQLKDSCLTEEELWKYGKGKTLYAWHIDDLIIYDKSKELSEFSKYGYEKLNGSSICSNSSCPFYIESNYYDLPPDCIYEKDCILKRPPQSWCYVGGE